MSRFITSAFLCILGLTVSLSAQTGQTSRPDNTKTNERDRDKANPTADQQKSNQSDTKITQEIRRSIVKDKTLSTYAHNVKIITQNGNVTLRGPVRSEEEKAAIEAKANEVAGANHVKSQIEVAPDKDTTKKTTKRPSTYQ
jgi:hyperosmotically inducible periplasmic protein